MHHHAHPPQGKIVNTPAGQLIVGAVVINDMIDLIIPIQPGALVGEATPVVTIPIVSALGFPVGVGAVAVSVLLSCHSSRASLIVPSSWPKGAALVAQRPTRIPSWCS